MNEQEKKLILGNKLILKPNVSDAFKKNMSIRTAYGFEAMDLPAEAVEVVLCSTVNKNTCVQKLLSNPNKYYLLLDEHHFETMSALVFLFYLFGFHDLKKEIMEIITKPFMKTPQKRLAHMKTQLQAENSLLEGNATFAYSLVQKLANYEITEDDYKGKAGALDYNWFCLKLRRHNIANAYIMNFYVFHELAHIKMDFDTRLSSYYHSLVHMQVNQLAGFVRAINPNVVDTSLLPLEDIACDTYALDLLFKFINANTGDYNFEFMVEAYLVAVSNNTLLNSIKEHTIGKIDFRKICWWRVFIALEILCLLHDHKIDFCDGIREAREVAKNKYDNYLEYMESNFSNSIIIPETEKEKYSQLSEQWEEEVEATLAIIREIY